MHLTCKELIKKPLGEVANVRGRWTMEYILYSPKYAVGNPTCLSACPVRILIAQDNLE